MNVAVIGPMPPQRGGISHYNAALMEQFARMGHDVHALGFRRLYPGFLFPGSSEIDPEATPVQGGERILVAWRPWTWVVARRRMLARRPEHLILHHWHPFFAPALAHLAAGLPKQRVTIVVHNVLPHEHRAIGRTLNPRLFSRAARVLVGSSQERSAFLDLMGVRADQEVLVAPHPVYDRFAQAAQGIDRDEERSRRGYGPGDVLFANLGLIRPYKGVDLLIDAFGKLGEKRAHLAIAGEFYTERAPYDEGIASSPARERIQLDGRYLSDEEMGIRLAIADAVVLPYRHGTQSGVAMAALALGTPVIASRIGALEDVVEDVDGGIVVNPGDVDALAKAMARFVATVDDVWRPARERIARTTAARHSWEALAQKALEGVR